MQYRAIVLLGIGINDTEFLTGFHFIAGFHIYRTQIGINRQIVAMPYDDGGIIAGHDENTRNNSV